MARFISIDCEAKQIGVTFDYEGDWKQLKKFIDEKFGEQVNINELSTFIPELQEEN